ncbi:MAG: glycosyltransferase [Chthoniobacterales bacterium]|nr:glycosyltransferase [Chthoniobacterales bacterium]
MHLHFVQSLEPLQGAGLGQAALSLHLAMQAAGAGSKLLSTRSSDFAQTWPDVIQGVRRAPARAFYAPELKRLAADAVAGAEWFHGHGLYVWTNMWLGGEARRRGRPLVYHPHGFFDPWILRRSKKKKQLAHWLFEDRNFSHVRWWRALSAKEADQIRAVVGKQAKIEVIPNGVDLAECDSAGVKSNDEESPSACPSAWTTRKRPKRLLFLSRIHPKKGLDLLVPAWGRLVGEFPDWELLIVGPDEGGYRAKVERMISETGGGDACRICGTVAGAEKHALLRTADMFVLPSYSEGFPMAVLEAAAHRVPAVQTSECNFPELTAAGGAWECLPESGDLERALRQALAADDAERRERGSAARNLIETRYTWGRLAADLQGLCSSRSV